LRDDQVHASRLRKKQGQWAADQTFDDAHRTVDALHLCRRLLGGGSHGRSRGAVKGVGMEKSALERATRAFG